MRLSAFLIAAAVAAAGCTGSSNLCARVKCGDGKVCNPDNGRCVASDGGGAGGAGGSAGGTAGGGATAGGSGGAGGTGGGTVGCNGACVAPQKCDTVNNRCVACLSDSDCQCDASGGIPTCVNGSCVSRAPPDGGLMVVPPAGESCSTAPAFTFRGCMLPRSFTFRASLGGHPDDEEGVCSVTGASGRDLVYRLSLEAKYDLDVTATPVGSPQVEPIIYLRKFSCSGQELACHYPGGPYTASIHAGSLDPGDYSIFIDAFSGGGDLDVTVTLSRPSTPMNDSCLWRTGSCSPPITTSRRR
jgi:hypothetical protein